MSGSCCKENGLKLEVGKTYCSNTDKFYKIIITRQWNMNIFEGEVDGDCERVMYLFSSTGTVLGYPGYTGHVLLWHLVEIKNPKYEYKILYPDGSFSEWYDQHFYAHSDEFYVVREKNKHETTRFYSSREMMEFKQKLK